MTARNRSIRTLWTTALAVAGLLLVAQRANAAALLVPTDRQYDPLELKSQVMKVKVDNQTAQTKIRHVFHNRYGRVIEATYLLPVPKGAHVTDFAMEMNGKKVHGEVLEKEKARKIYTDIVRRMRDPGLLEYVDQEIFRARVFPIQPRKDQLVEITVTHLLPMDNGVVAYEWPFDAPKVVTQRGRPESPDEFDLKLDVHSKVALKSIYSPTHKIDVDQEDKHHALVRLDEEPGRGEPIFKCYFTLSDKAVGLHVLTVREEDEDGTFLLMISPDKFHDDDESPPVDFTFVIDTSGSMNDDEKMAAAKKALKYCLGSLRSKDAFKIIRFSTEVESFSGKFLEANESNLRRARKFIDEMRARGGTNIDGALGDALVSAPREDRLHTILFITDGKPTVGATNIDTILKNVEKKNRKNLRIFACGVGYDVNTKLLDRIVADTRSVAEYIRPKEDLEVSVGRLFDKISQPVLTGLEIDWGGLKVRHVYPKELPDLFAGTQLTVFGRYRNGGDHAITLTGKVGGKDKKFVYEATFPKKEHEEHAFVETLWATRRVGYLLTQIRENGESKELREEVVELAKKHGIVTPYTSYLVQEDEPRRIANLRPVDGRGIVIEERFRERLDRTEEETRALRAPVRGRGGGTSYGFNRLGGDDADESSVPGERGAAGGALSRPADATAPGSGGTRWSFYGPGGVKGAPKTLTDAPVSGETAVELSKRLSDLRDANAVAQAGASASAPVRAIAGRTFYRSEGAWKQTRSQEAGKDAEKARKTLKIKYLGDAYFELLKLRPDLKKVFALGERVEFDINDFHIVIGPEGEEKLEKSQLDLLKKR